MPQTVLNLVLAACYEANAPVPSGSTLVGLTDTYSLQLLNLFYATGRELLQSRVWAQLKRTHKVKLEAYRADYPLPADFYSAIPRTEWDHENGIQVWGPLSDEGFNYRLYGISGLETQKAFRVFGPDFNQAGARGQLKITPTPGEGEAGQVISFDYISRSWLLPKSWAATTAYTLNTYVNSNGNIYKCSTGGTSGTVAPSVLFGEGQDGGVFWTALTTPAWTNTTAYAAGDYVTNSSNLYLCTSGGISAGSGGPTTTSDSITDGSVTWSYCASSSWTAQTEFERGDYIKISSQYYKCTNLQQNGVSSAKTGKNQPTWTPTTQTDGTVVWTDDLGANLLAYELIVANTDLCLFDDDLMIEGLKWRFMKERGLGYEDTRRDYERMKSRAAARFNPARTLDLGGGGYGPTLNIPEGNFG